MLLISLKKAQKTDLEFKIALDANKIITLNECTFCIIKLIVRINVEVAEKTNS